MSNPTPSTETYKEGLSLGPGTITRAFFYDNGAGDGNDHSAGLDAGLESTAILARYSLESLPSSESYYILDPGGQIVTIDIRRTVGWHEFKFVITEAGAIALIDEVSVGTLPLMTSADTFFIASAGGVEAYWDDVGTYELDTDEDDDGVPNDVDVCPGTRLGEDEPQCPRRNRYFINVTGEFVDGQGNLAGVCIAPKDYPQNNDKRF